MDNLITLIIVIVTIVSVISNIRKQQRNKSPQAKPKKQQEGLFAKLSAALSEMQQQMEAGAAKRTSAKTPWDQLMDAAGGGRVQTEPVDASLEDLILEEDTPQPQRAKPASRIATARRAEKRKAPTEPEPMARRRPPHYPTGRNRLRKAIVWSEILAPPVALREDHLER